MITVIICAYLLMHAATILGDGCSWSPRRVWRRVHRIMGLMVARRPEIGNGNERGGEVPTGPSIGAVDNGLLDILRLTSLSRRTSDGREAFSAEARRELTRRFAWSIPNEEAIASLVEVARGRGILEVGAGTGYWAALLQQAGADVRATDVSPPASALGAEHNAWHPHADAWLEIERLDAVAAASEECDRVLLLCWPPPMSPVATDAVRAYRGDLLAYVGEWFGGTTGDFELPELLTSSWELICTVDLPVWQGRDDKLRIFQRRP